MDEKTNVIAIHGGPGLSKEYFDSLKYGANNFCNFITYTQGETQELLTISDLADELETIHLQYKGKPIVFFAHSFGSIIALEHFKKYQPTNVYYIFNSWVYNNSWYSYFVDKFADKIQRCKTTDFQETMYYYGDLYFDVKSKFTEVFDRISFNNQLSSIQSQLAHNDYTKTLGSISNNLFSISSSKENIVSPHYTNDICNKLNINNTIIDTSSHFAFIDNNKKFLNILEGILKEIKC